MCSTSLLKLGAREGFRCIIWVVPTLLVVGLSRNPVPEYCLNELAQGVKYHPGSVAPCGPTSYSSAAALNPGLLLQSRTSKLSCLHKDKLCFVFIIALFYQHYEECDTVYILETADGLWKGRSHRPSVYCCFGDNAACTAFTLPADSVYKTSS